MRIGHFKIQTWFSLGALFASVSAPCGQAELGVFRSDSPWKTSPSEFVHAEIDDRTGEIKALLIQSSERGSTTRRISAADLQKGVGPTLSGGLGSLIPVEKDLDLKRTVRFRLNWNDASGAAQSKEIRFQRLGTEWTAFHIIPNALVSIDPQGRETRRNRVVPIDVVTFSRDDVSLWNLVNTERVGKVIFGAGPMQAQAVGLGLSPGALHSVIATDAAVSAARRKRLAEHEAEILADSPTPTAASSR